MEQPDLKLVAAGSRSGAAVATGRGPAVVLGVLALGCVVLATWLGADHARQSPGSVDTAREALERILEHGPSDPGVREAARSLRQTLGPRPLDARTRALYAGLLLEMAERPDDARAAAFHASRAAELAPVTVPVIRAASIVLVRSGQPRRAAELVREMFDYDPRSAAPLLSKLEPFLDAAQFKLALRDRPAAWLAWSRELRRQGRQAEADARLDEAFRLWPDDLDILYAVASRAVSKRDWAKLGRLLPPDRELPERPAAAPLFTLRARGEAETGHRDAAREDVDTALRLRGNSSSILTIAGDALLAAGDVDRARTVWSRGLYLLPAEAHAPRLGLLVRLARLEDAHGAPADALRAWRAVLSQEPEHAEGLRRVRELGGPSGALSGP